MTPWARGRSRGARMPGGGRKMWRGVLYYAQQLGYLSQMLLVQLNPSRCGQLKSQKAAAVFAGVGLPARPDVPSRSSCSTCSTRRRTRRPRGPSVRRRRAL